MIPCLLGLSSWLVKVADWCHDVGDALGGKLCFQHCCVSQCCVHTTVIVDTVNRLERLQSKIFSQA